MFSGISRHRTGAAVTTEEVAGFWRSTWRNRRYLLSWDLPAAAGLAGASAFLSHRAISQSARTILITEAGILSGILGVIIAGFAISIAFMTRPWMRLLARTTSGVEGDFFPFWFVSTLAVIGILVCLTGAVLHSEASCTEQRVIFVTSTFFSSYCLFATLNLVGFIASQGSNRALQILSDEAHE